MAIILPESGHLGAKSVLADLENRNRKTTKQSASAYAKASMSHTLYFSKTNYNKDCSK